MTREEQSDLVHAEVDKFIARDAEFATVPECVASWAAEATDTLGFPVIVIPLWGPSGDGRTMGWNVVSYAIPFPAVTP